MNERIKELAEQHGFIHEHMSPSEQQDALRKYEKFALLLIQECINKISQEQDVAEQNWLCDNGVHICHELTKHFGVEE